MKVSVNLILPTGNTFAVGGDLNLQCEIRGYPTPEATWYKDDVELSPSGRVQITGKYMSNYTIEMYIKLRSINSLTFLFI